MFGKKNKELTAIQKNRQWEKGFMDAIKYVEITLRTQQKDHGDLASINDMISIIQKDL